MAEFKERKLTVIEKTDEEIKVKESEKTSKTSVSSNPIAKKLMEFHHEKIGKFSVKDLFKH